MKIKAVKIIAIIVAVVLLFGVLCYLFFKPMYYRIFYPWSRITGTINISIDGDKYDLKESDVSGMYENSGIGIKFRKNDYGAKVSVRGGDYGQYKLIIDIESVGEPLEVVIFQYNWWNVAEFDLDISIDSASKEITFTSRAQVLDEDGNKITQDHSTSLKLSDEELIHYIVSL